MKSILGGTMSFFYYVLSKIMKSSFYEEQKCDYMGDRR